MLGIINYGMGNLASVQNALNYLQIPNRMVELPVDIRLCDRVILPGVGAFGEAMHKIASSGFKEELQEFALVRQRPLLGICLGMQLLLESSVEYGNFTGLGFVGGSVRHLSDKIYDLSIPHIGWNDVSSANNLRLMKDIPVPDRSFYFVHSYYCTVTERSTATGQVCYGFEFDVMFEAGNIYGVQFHPEKSQKSGLALLRNFGTL
ncbi:MAG: imidazole glycerol phosphate synthase subunit HisH [Geobacteraceae bacterium]|nr:imidazole glycerol phosphate synthase subunit HisH [Geobacteraceae bacterium]